MRKSLPLFFILFVILYSGIAAQDKFRTRANGAWWDAATWERWDYSTGVWENALRSPNGLDTITVSNGYSVIVSTNISTFVLSMAGTLLFSNGASLETTGPCSLTGTVSGNGAVLVSGYSVCDISNLTISVPVTVTASASVTVSGNSFTLNNVLTNYGTAQFINGGVYYSSTGSIANYGVIACYSGLIVYVDVINYGVISSSSVLDVNFQKLTTTATGVINVNANARMSINTAITPSTVVGTINVASGGTFEFANGSVSGVINLNASIQGAGKVKFSSSSSTINCNGIYNVSGTSNFNSGNVFFTSACTIQAIGNIVGTGGKVTFNPGVAVNGISNYIYLYYSTLTLNTGASYTFDSLYVDNSTIAGDTITVTKKFTTYGCTLNGTAPFHISALCTTYTSSNPFTLNRPLLNDGVVFWGNNSFYGSGTFTNNGTLNYNSSSSSLQCRLVNSVPGILNLNGTGPVWLTCTLTNNGTINLLANQSYITANPGDPAVGGTFNISAGASVTFSNDTLSGIINNAGSITTSFSNWFKGTYNSTGTLTVTNGSVYFMSGCSIPSMGFIASKGGVIYFKPGAVPHGIQDTLTILGKIEFSGGSTLTFKDLFIGYYGTLDGSDSVVVTRTFSHQGYLYGTGRKVLSAGCSGTIFNSGWISDTLCNYGALEWKDGDLKNYGRIINYNSLTITAASTGYSYVTIENYGTINRPSGNIAAITFSYPVRNFGTINLNGGTNSFNGNSAAVPITGIINSGATVTTNFYNTDLNGTINAAYIIGLSGTANITGTFNNTGTTTNNNGTVTFKSSAVIQNVGTINCAAGSMYFKPGAFIQALSGTLNCIGLVEFSTGKKIALSSVFIDWHGTLQGTDSVTVSTSFSHSGYLRGWGKKILLNSCVGSLSNNAWINDSLYNYGTLNWNDLDIADYGRIFNYGTFNIASTGNSTCYVNIENFGTINRNTTAVSNLTFSYPLLNSGIFNINGGTVFIYANSSNAAAGIINIAAGAKLQLSAAASLGGQISISALGILAGSSYALTFSGHSLFNDGTITTASISFPAITAIGGSGAIATGATVSSGGRVTLSSDHQFKTLTINSGGSFDVGQMILKLNGSGNPLSITGSFSAQSGTVEFNGTAAQIVIPLNFAAGGVNCNNAAGITLSAPWSHPGTLHLAAGVFNNGTNLTLLNNARIKRSGGTLQTVPSVTGKIHILYSHTAAITTGNELPNAASEISSITIDDTAGVTLSKDVVVNDSVVFMQGNLYTPGNFLLSLASGAQLVNESNTGYVVGSASISRTLGYQASAFGNIGAALSAGSDSLGLTAILRKTGPGSALSSNGNSTVNRRWLITSQFPPASGRSLTFHWLSADDNGHLFTPDDPAEVWRLRDTAYESLWNISSVFGMNPRSLTIDGVSELGTFSAALHSTPLKSKRVEIKALIDGFYKGTTMTPDTILVCFTSTTVPYLVIDSVKAFTDSNGLMAISVDAVTNSGSYFVKLKHRNAVETWSAAPVTMVNYELLYDFTASAGQAYGDNLKLVGTKYCLYGGDVNQDGIIDYSDLAETENDSYNFASGYLRTDVTGDQFVDYSDLAIVDNNSFNFIGVITPLNKKAVTVRKLAPHPARKEIQSPPGVL